MPKHDEWKTMKSLYDTIRRKTDSDLRTFEKSPLVKPYPPVSNKKAPGKKKAE